MGPAESVILPESEGTRLASLSLGNVRTTALDVAAFNSSASASVGTTNVSVARCERSESLASLRLGDEDENEGGADTDVVT